MTPVGWKTLSESITPLCGLREIVSCNGVVENQGLGDGGGATGSTKRCRVLASRENAQAWGYVNIRTRVWDMRERHSTCSRAA